jgi:pSer/pThr/pTyr-binding forkhead associated (FHA) protein
LAPRHGTWVFQDLGSSNGSLLNGHPVTEAALGIGDELRLGATRLTVGPGQ